MKKIYQIKSVKLIFHWIEDSLMNLLLSTPQPKMKVMMEFHPLKGGLVEKPIVGGIKLCF
jgi:hypothetical protein